MHSTPKKGCQNLSEKSWYFAIFSRFFDFLKNPSPLQQLFFWVGGWVFFWPQNPYISCARQFFFRALCAGLEKIFLFWLICQVWFLQFAFFGLVFQKPGGIETWAKHTPQALVFTILKPWGIPTARFTSQVLLPSCVSCLGPCKFGIVASHWLPWSHHLCLLLRVLTNLPLLKASSNIFVLKQILPTWFMGNFLVHKQNDVGANQLVVAHLANLLFCCISLPNWLAPARRIFLF